MKRAGWILFIYGFLIFLGGVMGYVKAASSASLMMGTIFGLLLIISSVGMLRERLLPAYFGLILTFVLTVFFIYRYLYTFKFFPSACMGILSLGVLVLNMVLLRTYFRRQRRK